MQIRKSIRKAGVPPHHLTKYDLDTHLEKTRPIEDYLSNKYPMQSDKLKIRLIGENILDPCCSECTMEAWFGQPIPLELDHRNGDSNDNRLENLRLLCPNCHAQTANFRVKKDGAKSVADVWEKGKD